VGRDEYTNTVTTTTTTTTGNQISTTTTGIPETAYYCLCMTESNGNTSACKGVIIYTDKPHRCPTFLFFLSFSGLEQKHKQCPDLEAMLDTHIGEHSSKQHIQRYIYTREEEARHDDDEGRRRLRREERRGGYRRNTGVLGQRQVRREGAAAGQAI